MWLQSGCGIRGGSKRRRQGDGREQRPVTKQGDAPRAGLTIWTQKTGASEEYRLKVETGESKLKKKASAQIYTTLPPTFPSGENLGPRDPVPLALVWCGLVRQGLELEAIFLPLPSKYWDPGLTTSSAIPGHLSCDKGR